MDNLQEETAALENVLSYQNDYITSLADPLKRRGYWYYMPSSQVRKIKILLCVKQFDMGKSIINLLSLGGP